MVVGPCGCRGCSLPLVIFAILPRIQARATLQTETAEMAIPTVSVAHPRHTAPAEEVVLPASVQAYIDSPIYARTNGYLKRWYVDIGAHVKAGQLLAEIDTPEVDQQLHQSRADLATAEANVHLAQITAERYSGLLKTDSVSKQDADNAENDYAAKKTIVQSSQANVKRLEDLQSFQKIYAPFDGVITARNTDIGALIDPGSSGGTRTELFHIAQPGRLRVYVNVPEAYSQAAKPGLMRRSHADGISRPPLSGQARPHRRCHRSCNPHSAGRDRGEQSERRTPDRRLRRSSSQVALSRLIADPAGRHPDFPLRRSAGGGGQSGKSRTPADHHRS